LDTARGAVTPEERRGNSRWANFHGMSDRTDEPGSDADGKVAGECAAMDPASAEGSLGQGHTAKTALPLRSVGERSIRRAVRRMDDPEILERVLAGLLDLW
jgi:hypothetical protein